MIEVDQQSPAPARAAWARPRLERLPKLTQLTLATPAGDIINGSGSTEGSGGTVF